MAYRTGWRCLGDGMISVTTLASSELVYNVIVDYRDRSWYNDLYILDRCAEVRNLRLRTESDGHLQI